MGLFYKAGSFGFLPEDYLFSLVLQRLTPYIHENVILLFFKQGIYKGA